MAKKRQAFIFTTDAFLVLPLVILIVTMFISFSVTLKESLFLHEYTLTLARNQLSYLTDLQEPSLNISVLDAIAMEITDDNIEAAGDYVQQYVSLPGTAGYYFEYFDGGEWVSIADKQKEHYKFSVSVVKLVTGMTTPTISYTTIGGEPKTIEVGSTFDYLLDYPCASDIACATPTTVYNSGRVCEPVLLRIRVFT